MASTTMTAPFRRRVVVTGMGAVSPLGNTLEQSWNNLMATAGDETTSAGVTTLEEALFEQYHQGFLSQDRLDKELALAQTLPCQVAAPVKGLRDHFEENHIGGARSLPSYEPRRTARFVQLALFAGAEAMEQAQLVDWLKDEDDKEEQRGESRRRHRFGVCVGSGMSGVREITQAWDTIHELGLRKLSPQFIPKVLTNSASGRLSLEFGGLQGPNVSPSTACAAGSHAIGEAFRYIQYGTADLMLAGGAEASIEPVGLAGFCRLRALSTNFSPDSASRPFDAGRDGFVMGEGSAILVLEELEHAQRRGASIMAEICGYGLSGDAFHITAPDDYGGGAERAMRMALNDAEWTGKKVGYVNAHATSTPKGDEIEAMVIDRVLNDVGNDHPELFVSSTKGATGHLLGAAGALEAAFTIKSLMAQELPPTRNLENPEVASTGLRFNHVMGSSLDCPVPLEAAISNSFGFGGTNASVLFCTYNTTLVKDYL